MDECKCMRDKDFGIIYTKLENLTERDKELYTKMKENRDSIKLIEKVSLDIAIFAEQMVHLTSEIKDLKTDMCNVKKYPSDYYEIKNDYTRTKKIADNLEHYKKLAIGAIILAIVGAFVVGMNIRMF